jgi:hypothetical protein
MNKLKAPKIWLQLIGVSFFLAIMIAPASAQWTQLGSNMNGEAAQDQSGNSVSISSDGLTVAIGAPFNNGNGTDAGHVRVYKHNGTSWVQQGTDIDAEATGDWSGYSVSISDNGERIAVGAHNNDGNGQNSGQVRVYEYNGSAWAQLGADIDGEAAFDQSGNSVSISGDGTTVAIGALANSGNGAGSGHVRVYKYNGSSWVQQGTDIDGEAAGDESGNAVSLSTDGLTVAIGAHQNSGTGVGAGHVRVYKFNGSTWVQQGTDIDAEDQFNSKGESVSLSADGLTVAIGAPYNNDNGIWSGHVRVFNYNGSAWIQRGSDLDGNAADDEFGGSVSLSDDGMTVAIGGRYNDGAGSDAGHVRVYKFNGSSWVLQGIVIEGGSAGDECGSSVSLSSNGETVAIGSSFNSANGLRSGQVRVFSFASQPTTQLRAADCGITITSFNQYVYADAVSGATSYQFRFTNTTTSASESYFRNDGLRLMKPSWVSIVSYGTIYNVDCRVKVNGTWGPFGAVCQVTTPAPPTTMLNPTYCGTTVSSMNTSIQATSITGATDYQFRFNDGSNTYTKIRSGGVAAVNLSTVGGLAPATTYTVDVRAKINGTWGSYGTTCQLTTPSNSGTTQLSAAYCNTAQNANNLIYCTTVSGADKYQFKFTEQGNPTNVLVEIENSNKMKPIWLTGLQNVTYDVIVRARIGGVWTSYGTSCTVLISGAPMRPIIMAHRDMESENEINEVAKARLLVYPNPNNGKFQLQLDELPTSMYTVTIHNALGQMIYNKQHNEQTIPLDLKGVEQGFYFLRATVGEQQSVVKVAVR